LLVRNSMVSHGFRAMRSAHRGPGLSALFFPRKAA
jgi:hypothetical protein